ncbi:hypothetical protein SCLCIDRAFT_1218972 [Scleroderma citrinum Foug A]|uniref:Uncharacterized protein n=1 Tax=Scleroderma citrinum Foug A TaxID=1036808 RepID=A0A0C3A055_9AGAM|nr:hypothetical protein SCLCIDRAFT_1218972 [Scleroderma citrinum Foug A]
MLWMVPPARVTSFISTTTPSLCPSRSLLSYHKFFASQVIGPSVWPILSTKVLANLNKGSPPHRPTNHFPIIPRRKPLLHPSIASIGFTLFRSWYRSDFCAC